MRRHFITCAAHALGISESTSSRARTSSLRLVSCVDVVNIECGQCSARSSIGPVKLG